MEQVTESVLSQTPPTPQRATDGGLEVEVRQDLDLGCEDVAALDTFIESRPDVGVFMSRAWLSGFLADPPPGSEPMVVLLRERGVLKGIAPLAVRRHLSHIRVCLLGGGAGSDRVDLLTARSYEAACSDRFVSWLEESFGRRACVFELRDVPLDSPLWGALYRANAGGSLALTVQPREVHTLPFLDLAEFWTPAVEANSQLWGATSLERHRRWLERRGRTRFDLLEDPDEVLDAFGTLAKLLRLRWSQNGAGSAFDQPRTIRFHQHVLPLLLKEKRLRMLRLSVDARVVAVLYVLASAGWRGSYVTGYDREWAGRIHLGRVAYAAAIERAARQGATEFDFLKGAERVKYLWPVRTRSTLNADVYPANTGAQLLRAGAAARDSAAALTKSVSRFFSR